MSAAVRLGDCLARVRSQGVETLHAFCAAAVVEEHIASVPETLRAAPVKQRRFGIGPGDIQVLTPTHRGPAGAGNLNTVLQ